jgi:hypothetical protein
VNPALLQRQAALAGAALLATLGVLALQNADERAASLPPVGVRVQWEHAVVAVLPASAYAHETACDLRLDSGTLGVAHPVLPCGVDLIVAARGREVRTEVVERGPVRAGHDFELTRALANDLGVRGTETIRWRFAG